MLCWWAAEPSPPPAVTRLLYLYENLQAAGQGTGRHVRFSLTDQEINQYLEYSLRTNPRPGIRAAAVKVFPDNYASLVVLTDFDALESSKPGAIPPLLRPVLSGEKEIRLDVRFRLENNALHFSVEKAYFQKLRVPALLAEKLIVLMAARQPEKFDPTKPLPLPFRLRRLFTARGVIHGES